MDCPKCRHVSLPGASYCEKCGFHLKGYQRQPSRQANPYLSPSPGPRPSPAPVPCPKIPPVNPVVASPPIRVAPAVAKPVQPSSPRPATKAAPAPPPPFAQLQAQGHNAEPKLLTFDRNLVGRIDDVQPEVDLGSLGAESGVSRKHAQITRSEGQVWLEDLSSANGTFLNEVRLQPGSLLPLKHQDEIRFGSLRFRFLLLPPS